MIVRESQEPVEIVRMNHGKASALDLEFCEAITATLRELSADDAVRSVILTGTGTIFSAGVDLYRLTDGGDDYIARYFPALNEMLLTLFTFPKPIVAAVNGAALAGGCLIALACDMKFMATTRGKIGVPELQVGVPFPAVAMEILRYAVGPIAHRMAMSGMHLRPKEAEELHVIDAAVDSADLMQAATQAALAMANIPPETFAFTKRQMRSESVARIEQLRAMDDEARATWSSPEIHARIRDYMAKTVAKK